ncbi:carbohydrate ABC transporter permease [Microlunatus soli]|uniref:Carbohydrate ABC transporter membrane protein 1, CUT1 family n=1 Tax=Microlunatus soli TaxID=630515 RepID=A0A1H2AL98_9ACTN|nr:sugar ABC transporter permease [Microlunatus soli]SDT46627.1 carbohydrate ABC transporter membrane protein 1, CUT1 family [Microlunatus soli]
MVTSTPSIKVDQPAAEAPGPRRRSRRAWHRDRAYPTWFFIPAAVLFVVLFAIPTFASFYFSLTRWTLFETEFIGLENYAMFFSEPTLVRGFVNTFIYGFITSGAKVVIGLLLGLALTGRLFGRNFLRSVIFFPVLVSTIGVGLTFKVLLNPDHGLVNGVLGWFGITGPGWLTDPKWALFSVAGVDIWKGLGIATLIYIAGIVAIPLEYYEAAKVDGAGWWQNFWSITLPLVRPATTTVILLSLIGGLRSFDLIWAMTKGGPGFTSDVIASVIYKQYQAGFYGLSTAGNVVLFVVVSIIVIPMSHYFNRREIDR